MTPNLDRQVDRDDINQNREYPRGPRLCIRSLVLDILNFRCLWDIQVKVFNKPIEKLTCSFVREIRVGVRDLKVVRIQVMDRLMSMNVEQKKRLWIGA